LFALRDSADSVSGWGMTAGDRFSSSRISRRSCPPARSHYHGLPPREAYPKAKAAAEQALKIDETLAEPHASLAWAKFRFDWDWPGAEREFKRAIELNPRYPTAHHWYAYYLASMGRLDQTRAAIQRAQELDPLSLIINATVGQEFYYAREYDLAIEQLRKTLALDSNFAHAHRLLGEAYRKRECLKKPSQKYKRR
jgi:adenylate cyclase